MIVLADNDIIHKLCCCQLVSEFLAWLKVPPTEVFVLNELKFWLRKKVKDNAAALVQTDIFLAQTKTVPAAKVETLDIFLGLDGGEQVLFAALYDNKHVHQLITGDKRALRQLGELLPKNQYLKQRLDQVRVDCLETVLLGLHHQIGFAALRDKVLLGLDSDKVLGMTFGAHRDEAHMQASLGSYIKDIQSYAPFVSL